MSESINKISPAVRIMTQDTDSEVNPLDVGSATGADPRPKAYRSPAYLLAGIFFGIVLVKSEVISWFRIQEMFRLQSFHMYGVIGTSVITGMISLWVIRKFNIKTLAGEKIVLAPKRFNKGQIIGGLIFGFGWAMTGACPGPIFAQIGAGSWVAGITLLSAIAGTFAYGSLQERLPH